MKQANYSCDWPRSCWPRFGWRRTLAMHLLPGVVAFLAMLAAAPLLGYWHLPLTFSMPVVFGLVVTPLELGILLYAAHKATGMWSLRALPAVLAFRQPIRRWWFAVPALFVVAVAVLLAWTPAKEALATALHGILPYWMLPSYDETAGFAKPALIAVSLVTLLIDGIINPAVEELYFRGYLLPRLPIRGWVMVPVGALLFAVEHLWQPFNWGMIFVLECILIACVIRARSFRFGIAMHVLVNSFGALLTLASVLGK
ncbi:MAG TPA: CPBP family intramembrane glutamic endopeptidase [Candidatus Saccharimonadales bacterium]|nr:CPBP family intramembrane glutamic endopeptidase [Candidatus Saccharimonadales bacterium]